MDTSTELTDEQQQAQDHPPAWSSVFGDDDMAAYAPQDQPGPPGPRSSAARHAGRRTASDQDAKRARELAQLQVHAKEQAEDHALDQAQELLRAGKEVPPKLRVLATRALQRRGVHVSSAEQMAAAATSRRS